MFSYELPSAMRRSSPAARARWKTVADSPDRRRSSRLAAPPGRCRIGGPRWWERPRNSYRDTTCSHLEKWISCQILWQQLIDCSLYAYILYAHIRDLIDYWSNRSPCLYDFSLYKRVGNSQWCWYAYIFQFSFLFKIHLNLKCWILHVFSGTIWQYSMAFSHH